MPHVVDQQRPIASQWSANYRAITGRRPAGSLLLAFESDGEPGEGMILSGIDEVQHALSAGRVRLHSKVKARVRDVDENGAHITHVVETTPGRVILAENLPTEPRIAFKHVNTILTKKAIGALLDVVYRACGQKESVVFADRIMRLGFQRSSGRYLVLVRMTWSFQTPSGI